MLVVLDSSISAAEGCDVQVVAPGHLLGALVVSAVAVSVGAVRLFAEVVGGLVVS